MLLNSNNIKWIEIILVSSKNIFHWLKPNWKCNRFLNGAFLSTGENFTNLSHFRHLAQLYFYCFCTRIKCYQNFPSELVKHRISSRPLALSVLLRFSDFCCFLDAFNVKLLVIQWRFGFTSSKPSLHKF